MPRRSSYSGPTWGPGVAARLETFGMSQRELARRAGLTQPTISRLITGAIEPGALHDRHRVAIARVLLLDPTDLFPIPREYLDAATSAAAQQRVAS